MAFNGFRLFLSEGIYKEVNPHGIPDMIPWRGNVA
jgi:hypothetical protein